MQRATIEQLAPNAMGIWRITSMPVWGSEYLEMQGPALIEILGNLTGRLLFGLVQADIDARLELFGDKARLDFSWAGWDAAEPVNGRGWMNITGGHATGHLFFHQGEDSAFTATKQTAQGRFSTSSSSQA